MLRIASLVLFCTLWLNSYAIAPDKVVVDSLIRLLQRGENDSIRWNANQQFIAIVEKYLKSDSAVNTCPDFAPNIACVQSPDNKWRLLTWLVPSYDGDHYGFYGFLQKLNDKSGSNQYWPLSDSTAFIKKPESEKLSCDRWFGATYYEVIAKKKKGKSYYSLLGWKGSSRQVTQKVIDVLSFDGEKPRFGYPMFKKERVFRSRIIFSFNATASMSLRYESSKRMIVFDHLFVSSPGKGGPVDFSQSGPDGSYDGYKFRAGRWQWVADVKMKQKRTRK